MHDEFKFSKAKQWHAKANMEMFEESVVENYAQKVGFTVESHEAFCEGCNFVVDLLKFDSLDSIYLMRAHKIEEVAMLGFG